MSIYSYVNRYVVIEALIMLNNIILLKGMNVDFVKTPVKINKIR